MIDDTQSMWNSDGSLNQLTSTSTQSLIAQQFPEEIAQEDEEIAEEPQEKPVEVAPQPKKGDAEENFYRLRKRNEELETEREQLRQQLAQAQRQPKEEFDVSLDDDEIAEGRHLSRVTQKVRQLEEQLNQTAAVNQQLIIEQRLKTKHKDFDDVVTKDNLEKLRDEYPEILNTILSAQDMYAQGITAYTMMKKLGIVADNTAPLQRINQNAAKPRSPNSVAGQQSSSALGRSAAFGELTPELKKALIKEMNEAASKS